jgi:hypothetical protein
MLAASLLALAVATSASEPDCIITDRSALAVLRYDDHLAETWRGAPARPVLDTPSKRLFRTVLREGAAKGPNFAGHMTIVRWGCGSSCVSWAAVDARTGKVTELPGVDYFSTIHVGGNLGGVNFRRDSRLLVLAGAPREDEAREGVYSYVWTGKGFRRIGFVPRARACEPFEAP